jgi:hypothetical protein
LYLISACSTRSLDLGVGHALLPVALPRCHVAMSPATSEISGFFRLRYLSVTFPRATVTADLRSPMTPYFCQTDSRSCAGPVAEALSSLIIVQLLACLYIMCRSGTRTFRCETNGCLTMFTWKHLISSLTSVYFQRCSCLGIDGSGRLIGKAVFLLVLGPARHPCRKCLHSPARVIHHSEVDACIYGSLPSTLRKCPHI